MYTIAAGLSFSLSLVLVAFAHFQPGTVLIRRSAVAILVLAIAFFGSGAGPLLPSWMTVMGTNMLLIAAGVLFYNAFANYCQQGKHTQDWVGWGIVLSTAIPFGYWGLIEPNGIYRSIVFSFATAVVNGRSAALLIQHAKAKKSGLPTLLLGLAFATVTVWMFGRGIMLLTADAVAPAQRGANPTDWRTVFWYIFLVSVVTANLLWMEVNRLKTQHADESVSLESVTPARGDLMLLWSLVTVFSLAVLSEVGVSYGALVEQERVRLQADARQTNDALAQHTIQVTNQIDILLRATRSYYLKTNSVPQTEQFVADLNFDKALIDNIYLIDSDGQILVPWDERAKGRRANHRDYFQFHQQTPVDRIHIGPVQTGQVTGKKQFRLTRRISNADGSFAGVVVIPLEPKAFSQYFQERIAAKGGIANLVGTEDRKIRARAPAPDDSQWDTPLDSVIWNALDASPMGNYRGISAVDGVERLYTYQRVGDLPLVMVTGFSEADIRNNIAERFQTIAFGALLTLITILTLATILTHSIRRREEQGRFMSMLSHELKTPLSVIRMSLSSASVPDAIKARIVRSVTGMNAIIERCIQADRLNHGLISTTRQPCKIDTLLEDLKQTAAAPARVTLTAATLPPLMVDLQLLSVILNNLIDNALKYSPPDSPVNITAETCLRQGQSGIRISVTNQAGTSGLPDPKQLFRKYYRAPGAHGKTGSGLGLHIAAGFARKIGGELRYIPDTASHHHTIEFELWIAH